MFDAIRNMRPKERKRFISSVSCHRVTTALANVLSFRPVTLASKAGVSEGIASKFLDAFSLSFRSTTADYVLPAPIPAVRVRPIVNLADKFLCPLPFNLVWAIKPRFEEALKQSNRWNSYQTHRGSFLVSEGLKSISKLLPGSQAYERLTYPIWPGEAAELDALILFDRYVFLLEAKGGEFGAARRGGKDRIKMGLAELVGDPLEQGARAWDYIRKNEQPVFIAKGGKRVVLDRPRYTEISNITLTLDSLDIFTPQMHRLRDTGVLGQHDLPCPARFLHQCGQVYSIGDDFGQHPSSQGCSRQAESPSAFFVWGGIILPGSDQSPFPSQVSQALRAGHVGVPKTLATACA